MGHLFFDRDLLLKQVEVVHHRVLLTVKELGLQRVLLSKVRDNSLMDLKSNLFFDLSADRLDHFLRESLKDLLLVVVNGYVWLVQMLHVPEHVKRVV